MIQSFKWVPIALAVGLAAGTASALFLNALDGVTDLQSSHFWLLWLLPFGGALVSYVYKRYGKETIRGNNLVLEQIHTGDGSIPLRMAPLVLFGTLMTHLFGGSAGREGTAVQMGGSLSSSIGSWLKLNESERRIVVLCGLAAGFGSVFGTPLAGVIFGLETSTKGSTRYKALLPCLLASYTGHLVTLGWGVTHSHYSMGEVPSLSWMIILKVAAASLAFGFSAWLFAQLTTRLKKIMTHRVPNPMLRSFIGGLIIIAFVYAIGSRDYLGLGLPLIQQAFHEAVSPIMFLLKTLFTSITLGSGFLGGEVTPLFVIGSTLGSAISPYLSLSAPFLAALGLASVFGAASKAPLACTVLGVELFGVEGALYFILACFISASVSGRYGIYESHIRTYVPKR